MDGLEDDEVLAELRYAIESGYWLGLTKSAVDCEDQIGETAVGVPFYCT